MSEQKNKMSEQKNKIVLFVNNKSSGNNPPVLNGFIEMDGQEKMPVALWAYTSKTGQQYWSGVIDVTGEKKKRAQNSPSASNLPPVSFPSQKPMAKSGVPFPSHPSVSLPTNDDPIEEIDEDLIPF